MAEFLLEIYTEEVPAEMHSEIIFSKLLDFFAKNFSTDRAGVKFYTTPVRMVFLCNLSDKFTVKSEIIRGPKISAPQQALEGFVKKYAITLNSLGKNGEHYEYTTPEKNLDTADILPQKIAEFLVDSQKIWVKTMRWNGTFEWIRPIRGITAIFNQKPLDGNIFGVKISNAVRGCKFSSPVNTKEIHCAEEYFEFLTSESIILNTANRIEEIINKIKGKTAIDDDFFTKQAMVITEAANLCEIPHVILGKIDEKFKNLPTEVIHTVMKNHQKYIPINTEAFAIVVDKKISTQAQESSILAGNMRVLNARLEDALFFYKNDKNTPPDIFEDRLKNIAFHPKIGSIYDRIPRITWIFEEISRKINLKNAEECLKTIKFMKLDLGSEMVAEFPELQGIMGQKYFSIGEASRLQYQNTAEITAISQENSAIILAEWLEYCISLMCGGEIPTSSRDPFGIRRRLKNIAQLIQISSMPGVVNAAFIQEISLKFASHYKLEITSQVKNNINQIIL